MLVSRFLLNLQETNRRTVKVFDSANTDAEAESRTVADFESVRFVRVVGSLGSTVDFVSRGHSYDGEEEEGMVGEGEGSFGSSRSGHESFEVVRAQPARGDARGLGELGEPARGSDATVVIATDEDSRSPRGAAMTR